MLDERIKEATTKGESSNSQLFSRLTPQESNKNVKKQRLNQGINRVKSPSDTTIYVPALNRSGGPQAIVKDVNVIDHDQVMGAICETRMGGGAREQIGDTETEQIPHNSLGKDETFKETQLILKISNFVDQLRLDFNENENNEEEEIMEQRRRPKSSVNAPGLEEAQKRMEHAIVETEKFKATIENPPGRNFHMNFNLSDLSPSRGGAQQLMINNQPQQVMKAKELTRETATATVSNVDPERQMVGAETSDDNFFHLTCHIDLNLKSKIENGEFVNLDKLLPKDSVQSRLTSTNETKLEWVQSEGNTYLVPAKTTT